MLLVLFIYVRAYVLYRALQDRASEIGRTHTLKVINAQRELKFRGAMRGY